MGLDGEDGAGGNCLLAVDEGFLGNLIRLYTF